MKMRILFILLFIVFADVRLQSAINWGGYEASATQLIIRFDDSVAPLLGFEPPLILSDRSEIFEIATELGEVTSFAPSFQFYKDFSAKHHKYHLHQYYTLTFKSTINLDNAIMRFSKIVGVLEVFPNYKMEAYITPNDPYFVDQWAHENHGQAVSYGGGNVGIDDCDTDTDLAWDISQGSPDITIAILDTGVDLDHPEFSGRIVPGYDFVNNDNNASDDHGHGTSCAGIAAAKGNNNQGIAGVAWFCNIMPIKVLDSGGSGYTDNIADGVQWASDNGANVISMSLGGGGYESMFDNAINYAVSNGTVVFAASGNDNSGTISYPAAYDNCIAVGALSPCNERKNTSSCDGENWWGSNYGNGLDFLAPGVRIHTTAMNGGYTTTFNGTSSACPHAAGIGALLLSTELTLIPQNIRDIMQATCDDLNSTGWDSQTGYGRLNAYNALLYLDDGPEIVLDIEELSFSVNQDALATADVAIMNVGNMDLHYWLDDPFGYQMLNSDNGDVTYEWIDIEGIGTQMVFPSNDHAASEIAIDFLFPFYENSYSTCIVNANGWVGFGEDNDMWDNSYLPNINAPKPAIFGFWDDLNPNNDGNSSNMSGNVLYHSNTERLIIWFDNVAHWWTNYENSFYDFQFVLYPDGYIQLNYRSMTGTSSATIGIQNADGSEGMQIAYDNDFAHSEQTLYIKPSAPWLGFSQLEGTIEPGNTGVLTVEIDATGLAVGNYSEMFTLYSNAFGNPAIEIPIALTVTEDNPCAGWVLGDINHDFIINILDIVLVVSRILENDTWNNECEIWAADINGDEITNILDIVQLVNMIMGD